MLTCRETENMWCTKSTTLTRAEPRDGSPGMALRTAEEDYTNMSDLYDIPFGSSDGKNETEKMDELVTTAGGECGLDRKER